MIASDLGLIAILFYLVFGVAPAVTPITAVRLIATLLAAVFSRLTVRAAGFFLSFFARSARLTVRAASLDNASGAEMGSS